MHSVMYTVPVTGQWSVATSEQSTEQSVDTMAIKQTVKKEQEIDVYQLGCKGWDTNEIDLTFCHFAFYWSAILPPQYLILLTSPSWRPRKPLIS